MAKLIEKFDEKYSGAGFFIDLPSLGGSALLREKLSTHPNRILNELSDLTLWRYFQGFYVKDLLIVVLLVHRPHQ